MSVIVVTWPDETEMWIVMVSMVSGALMYTVLVANTAAIITEGDPTAQAYKSKVLSAEKQNMFLHRFIRTMAFLRE